jgi:hypothetical protein
VKTVLSYLGRSEVRADRAGSAVRFSPNLSRPKVFFDAAVKEPVRFREAISALHEVVVGDLRFRRKDQTAYLEWKREQALQEEAQRRRVTEEARQVELARMGQQAIPADLERRFQVMHRLYWNARIQWANELAANDPELFRHLVPCDPVVTVAPDAVLFECFSKDESSYGCLAVDRDGFSGDGGAGLGTTNVDYSLALYEHFQTLRTYRPTRLLVDPTGFEVATEGRGDAREEKIDLPPSWLRGFGQIQAAMALPAVRVVLPVETVYSILAHLKRHREKASPRSLRFQLRPGRAPSVAIDPWNLVVGGRGPTWDGDREREIKVWGRRRLFALARVLPLASRVEVALLGNGLPSIWTAELGGMRFVLALSGWTTNDWASGAQLDLLAGSLRAEVRLMSVLRQHLETARSASLADLASKFEAPREVMLGSLHRLALQGQVMFDAGADLVRYRPLMTVPLSEAVLGPDPPEVVEGRRMARERKVQIERDEWASAGRRLLAGKAEGTSCEALLDGDGAYKRARCTCKAFHKAGLRAGPCRHLLALRLTADGVGPELRAPGDTVH